MAVVRIDALCECEGCQKRFGVELELAEDLKDGEYLDFEAMVRDTIRSGQATTYTWGVRAKMTVDRLSLTYPPTIQAGLMLCDVCSKKCDDQPIEGNLTIARKSIKPLEFRVIHDHFTLGPGWMRMKPRPMDHAARLAEAHMWAMRTWPTQVQSYELDIKEW